MNVLNIIHESCENVAKKMESYNDMIRQRGDMSNNDIEIMKHLACTIKDLKTAYAMAEQEEMNHGYSNRYIGPYSYDDGYSYRSDYSTRNRDGMGRYSSHDEMQGALSSLRNVMGTLPEDQRREVQMFVEKMERR